MQKFTFQWTDGKLIRIAKDIEETTFEHADKLQVMFTTYTVIRDGQVTQQEVLTHD